LLGAVHKPSFRSGRRVHFTQTRGGRAMNASMESRP